MDHQYYSLLLNIPVRQVINKTMESDLDIEAQLTRLEDMDINNYFILGK